MGLGFGLHRRKSEEQLTPKDKAKFAVVTGHKGDKLTAMCPGGELYDFTSDEIPDAKIGDSVQVYDSWRR